MWDDTVTWVVFCAPVFCSQGLGSFRERFASFSGTIHKSEGNDLCLLVFHCFEPVFTQWPYQVRPENFCVLFQFTALSDQIIHECMKFAEMSRTHYCKYQHKILLQSVSSGRSCHTAIWKAPHTGRSVVWRCVNQTLLQQLVIRTLTTHHIHTNMQL